MKRSLMVLVTVIGSTFAISAQASEGFFACTTESGTVFTGSLDGEANIENPRILRAGDAEAKAVEIASASLMDGFEIELIQSLPEESIVYNLKAKKKNGKSDAVILERAGESSRELDGVCIVKFRAGI